VNADVLVNLLLELNVLNVQDIDRELKILAATIDDPRAQKWLMRVGRHFVVNIDQLLAQPYRAKAEPRGHNSSKYHYDPKGGWNPNQAPEDPAEKGKWWGEKPMAGDPNACNTCSGSGFVWLSAPVGGGKNEMHPWTERDPVDDKRTCPTCNGTGKKVYKPSKPSGTPRREGFFPESKSVFEAGRKKKVAPPEEVIEPDAPGTYTSRLHAPLVQRDIDQNFSAYSTRKAPKAGIHGGPPTSKTVEPWVKQREKEQDIHYFDPIQTRRRELWLRLENFVNYANWMASTLKPKKPEEQGRAKTAELFFRRLETMNTGDVDGFRDVMRAVANFKDEVENKPWLYMDDPKMITQAGAYSLIRASLWQTVLNLSNRDGQNGNDPTWCTDTETHAKSYSKQGPLLFVDKNGFPYVLVHFESNQAKDLSDREISAAIAQEIAPVFADPKRFPLSLFDKEARFGGGGIKNLGQAVQQLRMKQGIRG
jgi:hypothetical protein